MSLSGKEFLNLYKANYEAELERLKLFDERDDQDSRIRLLRACIEKKMNEVVKYPITVGASKCRINITCIGDTKKEYPMTGERVRAYVGFTSKRRVAMEDTKIGVTCRILSDGPRIAGDNKKEWKGATFWDKFKMDVDFVEEATWIEYFGISSEKYQGFFSSENGKE
ncbi:hypothetical protein ECANGB1_1997 [Enterospora canceri]|uniref:Uncharacterized protein n=1 Tax=Enterospora canceri TaxID=1081671 RepID=A0A1Y1S561_9MICR|nr:hypothetical protein ECANGB1_1997 [Enterospora canceri]